ncbi:MAG: class I SAM-dependent methyltransferase [Vulcanimicrobiaceae bacterium]
MDAPVQSLPELESSLRDIERANRWLGGIAPVRAAVLASDARSVLDVGCGSGDIASAILSAGRSLGRDISVTCVDISDQMLQIARARTANPAITFVRADATALPFAAASFDVVMCNLALHHFDERSAPRLLQEMRRVAARVPLVCDLRRSVVGYLGAWALSRVATSNRLTRHDAPLSMRRASTPDEAVRLARSAGWRSPSVRRAAFFRMLLRDG